nr:bifunctional nicotinamidase/pyrazinamidase [uncultured Flavobacterium sp.]
MKNALLIIDIQNDFLPTGSLAVPNGEEVIPIINKLQNQFDLIIATQDWHPENHKSFACNHLNKKNFDIIDLNGLKQVLWPQHCVQGSQGANFSAALQTDKIATIIRKGMDTETDSYSGFFDNGKRNTTGLLGLLKEQKISDVYVCGLAADYCVYYTAKDAVENGFHTFYIEDASKAISQENYVKCKEELLSLGVTFLNSSDI